MEEMSSLKLVLMTVFLVNLHLISGEDCHVSFKNGDLIGKVQGTLNPNQTICSYLGVPYAAPPLGFLRFKSPVPASAWNGTYNATKQPNWCPQPESILFPKPPNTNISEDCLYLNVFQPQIDNITSANLPVMIYLHGGDFVFESADIYTPGRLLAKGDVILVVPQYRLGVLGFISTGDLVSPGNYGLKDQALAIKWVNENIAFFGGNPNQVTVFGESAGGASAMYQMLTPMNNGFIHGMIAQSGTALSYWGLDRTPSVTSSTIGKALGCPTNSSDLLLSCMRNISWEEFIKLPYNPRPGPVVELFHNESFITQEPLEILSNGTFPRIPVVIGATKHDGSWILADLYFAYFGPLGQDKDPEFMRNQMVPFLLKIMKNQEEKGSRAVSSSLEMAYLASVDRSSWNASMPGLVDLLSATIYKAPALHTAELLSRRGSKVYLYSFEHHSHVSFWTPISNGTDPPPVNYGIGHGDDLFYLFDLPAHFSSEDLHFSEIFVNMWTDFAKSGDPTPVNCNQTYPYQRWLPYNRINEAFMKLNITPTALSDYYTSWRPNGFDWN